VVYHHRMIRWRIVRQVPASIVKRRGGGKGGANLLSYHEGEAYFICKIAQEATADEEVSSDRKKTKKRKEVEERTMPSGGEKGQKNSS